MAQDIWVAFSHNYLNLKKNFDSFLKEVLIEFQEKVLECGVVGKRDVEKHGRSRTMNWKDT